MSNTPTLSILVVNYNTANLLGRCLRSVRRHLDGVSYELLVVDNGSSDRSAELVESEFLEVRLFRSNRNLGFAGGNNLALPAARGKYIWLLNSDTELLDGGAAELVRFLDSPERETVGIVGPRLVRPNGKPDACWGQFPTVGRYVVWLARSVLDGSGGGLNLIWAVRPDDPPLEVECVSGAALMIRRSVVERIGPMDERFFMFCEDTDWCLRARQAGFSSFILPGVRVQHARGGSFKAWENGLVDDCSTRSHSEFVRKHWSRPAVILYLAAKRVYRALRPRKPVLGA